jgi:hypothetical protein
MTPLATKIARELTLPVKQRRFDDTAGVLGLFDQDMHCFEVSALTNSVNSVLDGPLEADDVDGAWDVWNEIATMIPGMFLPSPVTWLEQVFGGHRMACVLREHGGGFSLTTVHDGPRGGCSINMCKFRARGILEAGDRIDVFDLAEIEDDDGPSLTFDATKVLRGLTPENAKPEDLARLEAAREIALLRVDKLNRKIERGNHMLDFTGAAHRFVGMCVLALDLINTPGLVGLRQHDPHRGLARRLATYRSGSYPLRGWSEVVLKHQTRIADETEHHTGVTYHKCLHFVRSHLRHYRDGKATVIPAHWRGDPALGIKRTRYLVAA